MYSADLTSWSTAMTDWASETTRYIEQTVANIRDRTVKPAHRATQYLVYGLLIALMATAIGLLLTLLAFRGLVILVNWALPSPDDNTWVVWIALGGMFCGAGGFLWSKRGSLH